MESLNNASLFANCGRKDIQEQTGLSNLKNVCNYHKIEHVKPSSGFAQMNEMTEQICNILVKNVEVIHLKLFLHSDYII